MYLKTHHPIMLLWAADRFIYSYTLVVQSRIPKDIGWYSCPKRDCICIDIATVEFLVGREIEDERKREDVEKEERRHRRKSV